MGGRRWPLRESGRDEAVGLERGSDWVPGGGGRGVKTGGRCVGDCVSDGHRDADEDDGPREPGPALPRGWVSA